MDMVVWELVEVRPHPKTRIADLSYEISDFGTFPAPTKLTDSLQGRIPGFGGAVAGGLGGAGALVRKSRCQDAA
jgi:hypothetical protein